MYPMNKPAMKLAMKGTLDARATIPKGAKIPRTFDMFAVIASIFMSRFPVYANSIKIIAKTPIVNAMPEILLTSFPDK